MKKQLSRQRRWQIKKQTEGKCLICGKPKHKDSKNYRAKHHLYYRKRNRNDNPKWTKSDKIIGRV